MAAEAQAQPKDRYRIRLEEQLVQLQTCQKEKGLESCMPCSEVIGCPIRREYVNAVYESMNKGQGGGFEF